MCLGKCSTQGADCPVTNAATQLAKCAAQVAGPPVQLYCLYICEYQGKTYKCPDDTNFNCVAGSTAGVKACQPK